MSLFPPGLVCQHLLSPRRSLTSFYHAPYSSRTSPWTSNWQTNLSNHQPNYSVSLTNLDRESTFSSSERFPLFIDRHWLKKLIVCFHLSVMICNGFDLKAFWIYNSPKEDLSFYPLPNMKSVTSTSILNNSCLNAIFGKSGGGIIDRQSSSVYMMEQNKHWFKFLWMLKYQNLEREYATSTVSEAEQLPCVAYLPKCTWNCPLPLLFPGIDQFYCDSNNFAIY